MTILLIIYIVSAVVIYVGGNIYHVTIEKRDLTLGDGISSFVVSCVPILNTIGCAYLLYLYLEKLIQAQNFVAWDKVIIKAKKNKWCPLVEVVDNE
jgi:hypothetical protein